MEFNTKNFDAGDAEISINNYQQLSTDCLVLGVTQSEPLTLTGAAQVVDMASDGTISAILADGDFKAKSGQTMLFHHLPTIAAKRVLLVGLGKQEELNGVRYRSALAKAFEALTATSAGTATIFLTDIPVADRSIPWNARQIVEAVRYATYRPHAFKSDKEESKLQDITIATSSDQEDAVRQALREGTAIADGVELARKLGDLPGNICTPSYLAEQAMELGRDKSSVKVQVLEKDHMEDMGMGALLAVARGSREPAKLITVEYRGGADDEKPIVLVGKGVTFDAGGISIKPAAAMDEMKFDMCGAASVLGVLKAVIDLALPMNIVGIVPATENLPDGNAIKPGDIVTTMSGQTVEILNTDAEGRLILCDALSYAKIFEPDTVIDIATLTGACRIALGAHAAGLLSNNEPLADDLVQAGNDSVDRAWSLPLWEEYQEQLQSNFADMANVGGRLAGTITAACFLSRFTKEYNWAHLDIAGVSALSGKKKSATGRPVALLTQYLVTRSLVPLSQPSPLRVP